MRNPFFRRDGAPNLINLHIVALETAVLIGGLFLVAYLLGMGFPVWGALAVTAATFALRMSLRGPVSALIRRIGLRKSMMIGSALYALRFALLPMVDGFDGWLIVFILAEALAAAAYWMAYHLYFAYLSTAEARGTEVAGQATARIVAGTLAPVLGGAMLAYAGPAASSAACVLLIGAGAWLLSRMPRIVLSPPPPEVATIAPPRRVLLLSASHALLEAGTVWLWPIVVFLQTGRSYEVTGLLLAILPIGMAALSYLVGDRIDRGFGHRLWPWVLLLHAAVIVGSALYATSLWHIAAAGLLLALSGTLLTPLADTALYDITADSPDSLRSIRWSESGWDMGSIAGLLLAATLSYAGYDVRVAMTVCALGTLSLAVVFARHYGARRIALG